MRPDTPNDAQAEFWNAQTAWIRLQAEQDACLAPVLDLALDRAGLKPGEDVLDIGCGTGASLLAAAKVVGDAGTVTGLDIAPNLLAMATDRCRNQPNVGILNDDAQFAAFEPRYDAVISRFGVMFFDDTAAAFANIAKALRAGGRVSFAVWGPAPQNPFFMGAANAVKSSLGPLPKVDRTLPGPFALEDAPRLRSILDDAGLSGLAIETVDCLLTPNGTTADFADLALEIGPAANGLKHFEATTEQRAILSEALIEEYAQYATPDGVRIPANLHLIHGLV